MRALVALVTAAALAGSGGPAVRLPAKDVASVALAASHVAWVHSVSPPEVYLDRKLVWRAPAVPVPPDTPPGGEVVQTAIVAASPATVAVERTVTLIKGPPCLHSTPPCLGAAVFLITLARDVWAGSPQGPLRRVSKGCVNGFDVDGRRVALAEQDSCANAGPGRVVIARGRSRVLVKEPPAVVTAVGLAGRFVVWSQEHRCEGGGRYGALVLYDLAAHRVSWCQQGAMLGASRAFDVEPDGKVATAGFDCDNAAFWISPRGRYRSLHAGLDPNPGIRIGAGRIAFERRTSCATGELRLVVVDLHGRRVVATRAAEEGFPFDFDGRRLAWVGADGIHVVRVSAH
jgi:hypothetical protein